MTSERVSSPGLSRGCSAGLAHPSPRLWLFSYVYTAPIANTQVWITTGDIILLSLREFQDDKADVIHRYTPDEARNLKTYGELKSDFTINEAAGDDAGSSDEEGGIEFEEAEIDDLCESQPRSSNIVPS